MPVCVVPESDEDYKLFRRVVDSVRGESVPSVSSRLKCEVKRRYYLKNSKLMCVKKQKPVIILSHLPDLLKKYHDEASHQGQTATIKCLENLYAGIPQKVVMEYVRNCPDCVANKIREINAETTVERKISDKALSLCLKRTFKPVEGPKEPPLYGIWSRVALDLIDMSNLAYDSYHWILHAKDQWSKFTYARPLKGKECAEVTLAVREMLYLFGQPDYLVYDGNENEINGREMREMIAVEFPSLKMVRPEGLTSRLIERANGVLVSRITAWMNETGRKDWVWALPMLVSLRNREFTLSTGAIPFELFHARDFATPEKTTTSIEQ